MPWDGAADWDHTTLSLVKAAIAARRSSRALSVGDEEPIDAGDDDVLAFRRRAGDEIVDVFAHRGNGNKEVALPSGAPTHAEPLVATGEVKLDLSRGVVGLGPWSAVALRRTLPPAVFAAWDALRLCAREVHAAAFAAGSLETAAPPVHLYLTVTERCNLRCAHCITHAPARTREGKARTLEAWLLDALAEVLPAVDYFGFVHGGESLLAPGFFDILHAIRRARGSRPGRPDIHLLSNGMLLDEARVRALIEGGVTSLAVSLDGASAATNDALRLGGRFDLIVARVRGRARAAAAPRRRSAHRDLVGGHRRERHRAGRARPAGELARRRLAEDRGAVPRHTGGAPLAPEAFAGADRRGDGGASPDVGSFVRRARRSSRPARRM
jgi:hypothetical protein